MDVAAMVALGLHARQRLMLSSALGKAKNVPMEEFNSECQRIVAKHLYEEEAEVITTFEMNRIASLTYGEDACDDIVEMIAHVLSHPLEYTVLTMQKALLISKHLLIYGSDLAVKLLRQLKAYVERLLQYNTVLLAHENPDSPLGIIQRIRGKNVDHGYNVRNTAKDVLPLVQRSMERLARLRSEKASVDSLVPIGSHSVACFATDKVRLQILQKRMKKQAAMLQKSNLAMADNGFGSGYNAKDGKRVVGAAHSIDEMIRHAELAASKKSYKDEPSAQNAQKSCPPIPKREDFYPTESPTTTTNHKPDNNPSPTATTDLLGLDFPNPQPSSFDLLSIPSAPDMIDIFNPLPSSSSSAQGPDFFGAPAPSSSPSVFDMLDSVPSANVTAGTTSGCNDPVSCHDNIPSTDPSEDLLSMMTDFSVTSPTTNNNKERCINTDNQNNLNDAFGSISKPADSDIGTSSNDNVSTKKTIMGGSSSSPSSMLISSMMEDLPSSHTSTSPADIAGVAQALVPHALMNKNKNDDIQKKDASLPVTAATATMTLLEVPPERSVSPSLSVLPVSENTFCGQNDLSDFATEKDSNVGLPPPPSTPPPPPPSEPTPENEDGSHGQNDMAVFVAETIKEDQEEPNVLLPPPPPSMPPPPPPPSMPLPPVLTEEDGDYPTETTKEEEPNVMASRNPPPMPVPTEAASTGTDELASPTTNETTTTMTTTEHMPPPPPPSMPPPPVPIKDDGITEPCTTDDITETPLGVDLNDLPPDFIPPDFDTDGVMGGAAPSQEIEDNLLPQRTTVPSVFVPSTWEDMPPPPTTTTTTSCTEQQQPAQQMFQQMQEQQQHMMSMMNSPQTSLTMMTSEQQTEYMKQMMMMNQQMMMMMVQQQQHFPSAEGGNNNNNNGGTADLFSYPVLSSDSSGHLMG